MEIPKHFGIETYAWKVGLIKKSLRILPIIFVWFFVPKNCPDTSRQKCVDSSRKQYVQWEYWNISTQKTLMILPDENVLICLDHNMSVLLVSNIYNGNIETFCSVMHEDLLYFKNLWEFYQLFMYDFLSQNVSIPDILL